VVTGGFYDGRQWFFDYSLRGSAWQYKEPEIIGIDFVQDSMTVHYHWSAEGWPEVTILEGRGFEEAQAYQFEDINDKDVDTRGDNLMGTANLKRIFEKWGGEGFIKSGFKWRSRTKDRNITDRVYDFYEGSFTLADVQNPSGTDSILNDRYRLGAVPDIEKARHFFVENRDQFQLNLRRSKENADPSSYEVTEEVAAAYLMGSYEMGDFRVLAGYRLEQTAIRYDANEVVIRENGSYETTNRVSGSRDYTNGFPAIYTRYRLNDRLTLIASLTFTLKRPDYDDAVPRRSVDFEDQELHEGNPNLDPTCYTNYDISVDYRVNGSGLVTLEGFYKEVEDLVFSLESKVEEGPYAGFDRFRLENSGSGTTQGLKLTWDQGLDPLPFIPEGLGFNLQYRYEDNSVSYPGRTDETLPFTHSPEQSWEFTLRYDKGPWYAHLKFAQNDTMLTQVDTHPGEDDYQKPLQRLDFNMSYQVSESMRIILDVFNMTDSPDYERYEGVPERLSQYHYSDWSAQIGLRWQI